MLCFNQGFWMEREWSLATNVSVIEKANTWADRYVLLLTNNTMMIPVVFGKNEKKERIKHGLFTKKVEENHVYESYRHDWTWASSTWSKEMLVVPIKYEYDWYIVVMWVGVRLFIYILGLLSFGQPLGVNLTLLILVWKIWAFTRQGKVALQPSNLTIN